MTAITLGVWLLLLQAPFSPTASQESSKNSRGTIEGVVTKAGSGEPLAKAQVTLIRSAAGTESSNANTATASSSNLPTVATGADGRFAFRNVAPGSYRIAVARNGYARQEYGQRVFGGQGRVVHVTPGQAIAGISVQLLPAGTIGGVVKDSSGEPLAGTQVQLLRATYNSLGQRTLQATGGDRTDDRGEYRVYWITPGRYYVAVNVSSASVALAGAATSPNAIAGQRHPTSYYPGTVDLSQASIIDVLPGVEQTAIDVVVPQQDMLRVRGRIVDSLTGRPPVAASVSIVPRGFAATSLVTSGSSPTYNPADGSFEIGDVAPGSYWVRATASEGSADSVLPRSAAGRTVADVFVDTLFSNRRASQVATEVVNDVDGLLLTLGSGVSIPALVIVEGQPLSAVTGGENIDVVLRPTTAGMLMNPSRHQPVSPKGALTLENVLPGEYAVSVQSLPSDYYVKDVQTEEGDALDRLLVSGPVRGALSIVLSPAGGRIDGTVIDERGRPVSGIQAVLVPARRPARVDLYKTAITDDAGRFVFRGIAPGDYKVLAWEALETYQYFDEDFMRHSEPSGTSVRISGSSKERVEVRLIKAPLS